MDTKIFMGFLLDHSLKEALEGKEHGLTMTLRAGKEYVGKRTTTTNPSLESLITLQKEIIHQLDSLSCSYLFEKEDLVIFPELLLG